MYHFAPLLVSFAGISSVKREHGASELVVGSPQNSRHSALHSAKEPRENSLDRFVSWWSGIMWMKRHNHCVLKQSQCFISVICLFLCILFKMCKNYSYHPFRQLCQQARFQFVSPPFFPSLLSALCCATFVPSICAPSVSAADRLLRAQLWFCPMGERVLVCVCACWSLRWGISTQSTGWG